jgi:acyl-CoA synthetase (AMP-forming)/AMP-acid ligase II
VCRALHRIRFPAIPLLNLESLREEVAARSDSPVAPAALTRDDIVEIVFTSGTTAEPRGVVISHGNILANLEPLEREIGNYRHYERIFHPLRFLNLLPLSHVFGQFLGIFLPQLMAATVIFQDTLNPSEVLQVIKKERVSVVVAVPRLMESLKDKIERDMEAAGKLEWFHRQLLAAKDEHFVKRWWRFPQDSQPFRLEVLGVHLGRRGARCRDGRVLAASELRRNSRLRPYRDHFAHLAQSSVSHRQTLHRQGPGRPRGEA